MKLFALALIALTSASFGVSIPVDTAPIDDAQAVSLFFQLVGGLKGAGTLAIVLVCVQVFFVLMKSRLGEKTGIYRMVILSGLALILGVLGSVANGQPLVAALINGSNSAFLQAFLAQLVIQLKKRGEDRALTIK